MAALFRDLRVSEQVLWRARLQKLIRRCAKEGLWTKEILEQPAGSDIGVWALDRPLLGLRAAHLIREAAIEQVTLHALQARGAGWSWDEIGAAMGLPTGGGDPREDTAYEWIVEGRDPDRSSRGKVGFPQTRWRCGCCEREIEDAGPFGSSPVCHEYGHADDCARWDETVREWDAARHRQFSGRGDQR